MSRPPDWIDPREQLRSSREALAHELELARRVETWLRAQLQAHEQVEAELRRQETRLHEEIGNLTQQASSYAADLRRLYREHGQGQPSVPTDPAPSDPARSPEGRLSDNQQGLFRPTPPSTMNSATMARTIPGWMLALLLWSLQAATTRPAPARPVWAGAAPAESSRAIRDNSALDLIAVGIVVILLLLLTVAAYSCGQNTGSAETQAVIIASSAQRPSCACQTAMPSAASRPAIGLTPTAPTLPSGAAANPVGRVAPVANPPAQSTPNLTPVPTPSLVPASPTATMSAVPSPKPSSADSRSAIGPTPTPVRESQAAAAAALSGGHIAGPPDTGRFPPAPGPPGLIGVEIILDASGSMNEAAQVKGLTPKIAIAKDVAAGIVNTLPPGVDLAFRVYGHRLSDRDQAASCADIELIQAMGPPNKPKLDRAIAGLQARGWTPLAKSLDLARVDFPGSSRRDIVILISDGVETCGGDPLAAAARLKAHRPPIVLDTIGFAVDASARAQMSAMAKETGGQYADATDAATLRGAIQRALSGP